MTKCVGITKMEDTGDPVIRKKRERKTYKVSLNLDNPIENHIHGTRKKIIIKSCLRRSIAVYYYG